eukprot:CAMPEP_0115024816 /NCGR_PEP_ID=MMETSP0216-20121206/33530_1 /TAXON_ID=223996 /ORGANISM="Protocruzia adherens, Strain Boccale" /LENGTH=534 /DNA_ID=CAMNT_0002399081 /DNA_START=57 /DNA_END=1661 /DNA_ORIENTATION=+
MDRLRTDDGTRVKAGVSDPALKRSFRGHRDTISAVQFNPNLKQVASSSYDGCINVWNFKPDLRPFKFVGHKGAVNDIAFSPAGNILASCSKDQTIRLWNNNVEGYSTAIKAHSGPIRSINFSCDGQLLLSGSDDKTMKVWSVSDRRFQYSLSGHSNWIRSCKFSPDSRLIASGSDDKTVRLWDTTERRNIHTFNDHSGIVKTVQFHPDGTCIASGSEDRKIKVWDIRSKRLLQHYDAHSDNVNAVAFHPSGSYLLSASNDATLKIWDLRQGHILYTLYGHEGASTAVAFSPSGEFFVSGSTDTNVMVWQSNLEESPLDHHDEASVLEGQLSAKKGGIRRSGASSVKSGTMRATPSRAQPANDNFLASYGSNPINSQRSTGFPKEETSPFQDGDINLGSLGSTGQNFARVEQTPGAIINDSAVKIQHIPDTATRPLNYSHLPEELATVMDKIVDDLDIITKTLRLFEQRMTTNENQIERLTQIVQQSREAKKEAKYQEQLDTINQKLVSADLNGQQEVANDEVNAEGQENGTDTA